MIFLDCDVIIEILNSSSKRGEGAIKRLEKLDRDVFSISAIVYEEVLFGIYKKMKIDELPSNHPFLRFPVVNFTKGDAELAAKIEIKMEQSGKKKPRGDILIAATVINNHAQLLTFNTKHYHDIPNLKLIDWD